MMKWIKTSDRLPEKDMPVLAYNPTAAKQFRQMILGYDGMFFKDFSNDESDLLYDDGFYMSITHWMPLPPTPINP